MHWDVRFYPVWLVKSGPLLSSVWIPGPITSNLFFFLNSSFLEQLGWLGGKVSACNAGDKGDVGFIPVLAGNGNPLQYSCLGNSMDREAWCTTVHEVERSGHDWTQHTHLFLHLSRCWLVLSNTREFCRFLRLSLYVVLSFQYCELFLLTLPTSLDSGQHLLNSESPLFSASVSFFFTKA